MEDLAQNFQVQGRVVEDMAYGPSLCTRHGRVSTPKLHKQSLCLITKQTYWCALVNLIHPSHGLCSFHNSHCLDGNGISKALAFAVHNARSKNVSLHAMLLTFVNDCAIGIYSLQSEFGLDTSARLAMTMKFLPESADQTAPSALSGWSTGLGPYPARAGS